MQTMHLIAVDYANLLTESWVIVVPRKGKFNYQNSRKFIAIGAFSYFF